MTTDQQKYLLALKDNNDRMDEIALGESIGFTNDQTTQIINDLVDKGKIEFQSFGLCSYRVVQ